MGARSYIVRGKGHPESFESRGHGAGRAMSRAEAKRRFTTADPEKATSGIERREDEDAIDETPVACKPVDAVAWRPSARRGRLSVRASAVSRG